MKLPRETAKEIYDSEPYKMFIITGITKLMNEYIPNGELVLIELQLMVDSGYTEHKNTIAPKELLFKGKTRIYRAFSYLIQNLSNGDVAYHIWRIS